MVNRQQIKANARQQIKGKIGILFLINLVMVAISFASMFIPIFGNLVYGFFINPAFSVSIALIYLTLYKGADIMVGDVFEGFHYFWGALKISFFSCLIIFCWSLLFLIPGIIKAYSYSMALFIYAENPDMGALEAMTRSQEMMKGHKMDFFVLNLSFFGWALLCAVTFGIAGIYVAPYTSSATVNFYQAIKPECSVCSSGCSCCETETTEE